MRRPALLGAVFAAMLAPVVTSTAAPSTSRPGAPPARRAIAAAHKLAELRVTRASAKLAADGTLTGTTVIENVGKARARATTAGISWKSSVTHGSIQLARFSVPPLKPRQRHKDSWHVKLPSSAVAGIYEIAVCADVLSQVHEASRKHECRYAGAITLNPNGKVKGNKTEEPKATTTPTETPKEATKEEPKEPSRPPDTTITSGPSAAVATATATFEFTSTQSPSTFQCSLDASAWAPCSSPQTYTGLAEGAHVFQVRALNSLGEVDTTPAEDRWTVETEPPVVSLTGPLNEAFTNEAAPLFEGTASNATNDSATVTLKIYGGLTVGGPLVQALETTESAGSWAARPKALAEGTYTAQASQADAAGGIGVSATSTFTVKLIPPLVTLAEPANSSTTNKSKPQFSGAAGTEAGASTTVKVNVYAGATLTSTPVQTLTTTASAGSWRVTPTTSLANGEYTAQAVQDDAAGNEGKSFANTFTVSATAPTVTVMTPKNGSETNNTTPTFAGAAGNATGDLPTVTVDIYSGPTATGTPVESLATTATNGEWSVQATTPLFDGEYTAQASQENEAGNTGVSTPVTFTVNTTPPVVTLIEPANGSAVGQSKPTIAGSAETTHGAAPTVTVKVYTGATSTGTPTQTLSAPVTATGWTVTPTTALSDGTYTAQATQTDEAGNEGKSSANTFTTETKAPGPVTGVGLAENTGSAVTLSWTNPTGPDYQGVVVRRALGTTPPSSSTEGTLVGETNGETHEITDKTVIAGSTYSYALFAHNALKQYATAATITVKAQETTGSCTDTWKGTANNEWNEAANWSNSQVPTTSDWVCIPSGAANLPVNLNTPQIVDGLTNAGELSVSSSLELSDAKNKSTSTGVLTIAGTLEVAHELEVSKLNLNGTVGGAGVVTVPASGALSTQYGELGVTELVNNGTATVAAERSLNVRAGAKFVNKGTLTLNAGASLTGGCGQQATVTEPAVSNGELVNPGEITTNGKTDTGSSPVGIGPNGSCLVTVDTGALKVASGELKLGGSEFNLDTGSTVTGGTGAQLNFEGTIGLNAATSTIAVPIVVTGTTAGKGNLVASSLTLAGTLGGTGTTSVPSGGALILESGQVDAGTLVNEGTATMPANASLYVSAAAKLVNNGALFLAANSSLYGGCGREATATEPEVPDGEFANSGAIISNATGGPAEIGVSGYCLVTNDTGALNVASGELKLGGRAFNLNTGASVTGGGSSSLILETTTNFNAANTSLSVPVIITGQAAGAGNVNAPKLKLAGTLNGSGTWTVPSTGTLTLESGQVDSGELLNEGAAVVATNAQTYVGTNAKLVNKGTLSLEAGSSIYGGCGHPATATEPEVLNGEFSSSGSITTNGTTKTGSSPVSIGYPNNYCLITHDSGSLNVASGELKLAGQSYNFDTGSSVTGGIGTKLILEATVFFNAATTTLPVPVVVTGQTAGAGDVVASSSLKLAGTLNGSGTWTVPSTGTLTLESGQVDSGELLNEGTAIVATNAQPYVGANAKLINRGALSLEAGSSIYGGCGHEANALEPEVANGEFSSSGSITTNGTTKTGSSPVSIGYPYNYCLVTHDSGSLNVASGELRVGGQSFNFDTGSSVTGGAGAKLVLEATISFNAATTTLPLPVVVSGQTAGAGNVVASSALKLAGTLNGSGTWTVPNAGTLTLESVQIDSGELVNEGTAVISTNAQPYVGANAKLINEGALSFAVGSSLYGGCGHEATAIEPAVANGEFVNSGAITTNGTSKTGSSPVTIGYPYNYYCLVTHDTGSLDLASGELKLGGSGFNFDAGSTVTGVSTSELVLEAVVNFNAASTILPVPVVLTGETSGAGNVLASDSLKLSGALNGTGTTTVPSGATLTIEGGQVDAGQLLNEGTASVVANAQPYISQEARLVNKGSLSFAVGSGVYGGCGHAATATEPEVRNGEFSSSGSITTNGSSETGNSPITISNPYNTCLVTHDSGSLNVASGQLKLGGSDFNFDTGSTVTGATSSQLVLEGTVSFNAASTTLPEPVVITGSTDGNGAAIVTNSLKLTGYLGGTGEVTVTPKATLTMEGGQIGAGELVNEGTASVVANTQPYISAEAKLVNKGSLSFAVGSGVSGGCGHAASATEPEVPNGEFVNSGSVTTNGTSQTGSSPVTIGAPYNYCLLTNDTGSLNVASGELRLGGNNFNFDSGSTVTGTASSQLVLNSTVSFNAANTTLPVPVVVLGNTAGGGNVEATDSLKLNGSLGGTGTVTVPSGGSLVLESGQVDSGTLVNEGSGSVTANAQLYVSQASRLINRGSLSFAVGSALYGGCGREATATESAIANGEFVSSGSITTNGKSETGSSPVTIGYPYSYCLVTHDSGSLNVASGELRVGGSAFNFDSGSSVTGASSSVLVLQSNVNSQLSSVGGIGTVEDNGHVHAMHSLSLPHFIFNGSLELSPGVLVSASSASTVSGGIELDGTGNFGRLNVAGGVTLNSPSLVFTSLEYVPPCGATITAVTAGTLAGGFGSVSGGNSLSEGSWEPEATSTSAGAYRYCPPPPTPAAQTYGGGSSLDSYNPSGYAAEPVNTATGAYNTEETDASMPGLGVPFTFTRSYTSSNPYSGRLGPGWTDSLNVFLTTNGSEVVVHSENGQETGYTRNGEGGYNGSHGARSVLATKSGGGWTLTRQDQERLTFDEAGQLITKDDRNGIGLTLSYNEAGQLTTTKDSAGREVKYTYNNAGLLATMALPLARTITYSYDASNQLTSVTDAMGGTTTYEYNAQGLLESITNKDENRVVTNVYDGSGRVIEQTDALGKTAKFTYGEGETTYTDANGHAWKDIYEDGALVEKVDPTGDVTRYAYDANLDRTAATDANGNTTTMTYNAAGDMLTRVSALGSTQSWTYDALNDVTSYTDGDGHKTTYVYDGHGNLLTTTYADGSSASETHEPTTGAVTSNTDALGHTTKYTYNSEGNETSVASPLGEETTYGYDAAGRRTSMVSPRGNEEDAEPSKFMTTYTYDADNRLLTVTGADGQVTTTTYDKVGNRESVTNPDGDVTSYTYNAQNELTSVTDPEGGKTSYAYDAVGNRTSTTTPLSEKTTFTYDADNRLTKVTNALGHAIAYGYDPDGNRISIVDGTGASSKSTYNADNQLSSVSYSDGTPTVEYQYDAASNRTQMIDGTGTTVYAYDELNRPAAVNGSTGDFTYAYDKNGHVTSRGYPDGSVVDYTYDADQRLATVTSSGQTTTYTYDANSELTQTKLPTGNGYTETTTYDPAGLTSSIADTSSKGTLTSFAYTYDAAGNPTKVVAAAATTTYTYDKDGRLTNACYGSSCSGGSYAYTYNADGSRTKLVEAAGTTTYTYDEGDELTDTEGPGGKVSYKYDADGRRTAAGSTTYAWNAANELTALKTASSTTTYAYDGVGNRVSSTSGGTTTRYVYDTINSIPELVLERNGATTLRRYVWGDGLVAMNAGGSEYYVAHDAQGSIVALSSASGAAEDTVTYDPFGNVLTENAAKSAPGIPLKYDAEYLDPTGLYHVGARQLDPTIGAFISTDPRATTPSQPAISPYLFVADQPTVLIDPTGEYSEGGGACGGLGSDVCGVIGLYQTAFSGAAAAAGGPVEESIGIGYAGPGSDEFGGITAAMSIYSLWQTADQLQSQASSIDGHESY